MPNGISPVTAAWEFKKALVSVAAEVMAGQERADEILVCSGTPTTYSPPDLLAFGRFASSQDPATLGSQRAREETLTCDLTISCLSAGAEDSESASQERALALLGALERHVRITDTTLGGVVRQCFLTSIESEGATPPEYTAQGRAVDVTATFTSRNRVRG